MSKAVDMWGRTLSPEMREAVEAKRAEKEIRRKLRNAQAKQKRQALKESK